MLLAPYIARLVKDNMFLMTNRTQMMIISCKLR